MRLRGSLRLSGSQFGIASRTGAGKARIERGNVRPHRGNEAFGIDAHPQHDRTDHAQHPAGRVGTVEDVAAMVAWLLSRQAGFVTGQEFVVDGGMSKKMVYEQ